jgi:hypothetical protein
VIEIEIRFLRSGRAMSFQTCLENFSGLRIHLHSHGHRLAGLAGADLMPPCRHDHDFFGRFLSGIQADAHPALQRLILNLGSRCLDRMPGCCYRPAGSGTAQSVVAASDRSPVLKSFFLTVANFTAFPAPWRFETWHLSKTIAPMAINLSGLKGRAERSRLRRGRFSWAEDRLRD